MANGHSAAYAYPLGRVYDESNLVVERENNNLVNHMNLLQNAINGILSPKAQKRFTKATKGLNISVEPVTGLCKPEE